MNDELLISESEKQESIENILNSSINTQKEEQANVNSIQDEMKKVIMDTQKNNIVLNAKQSIMLLNQEFDSKYKYRDDIRRKVCGLIESTDTNLIKKATTLGLGEESLINNPDYWLAPAFLSLCAWYSNNKELASNALNAALSKDAEMTSLLLCFVHLRMNRINTATKWLEKYLSMQTPDKIDDKLTLVIEAITNGLFTPNMQEMCLNKINEWLMNINLEDTKNNEIKRWDELLTELSMKKDNPTYPYIKDYVNESDGLFNYVSFISKKGNIEEYFNNIMNKVETSGDSSTSKIDKLIHELIYNPDDSEKTILNEIYKNKCIVECSGDLEESSKMLLKNSYALNSYNNLYTHLTNICLIPNDNISISTKKFALAITKEFAAASYQKIINLYEYNFDNNLTIQLEDLILNTKNGSNERELVSEIKELNQKKYHSYIYEVKLLNIYNIITILIALASLIFIGNYLTVSLIIIAASGIYNFITIRKKLKERQARIENVNNITKGNIITLLNILCEIVDIYFNSIDEKESYNKFIKYLQDLNYKDYFTKTIDNNKRNIITGGSYE